MNARDPQKSKLKEGLDEVVAALATVVLRALFLPEPTWAPNEERRRAFDALFLKAFSLGLDQPIDYTLPYPRHEFLRYLVTQQDVVLFGSNQPGISVIEPREQNDLSGQRLRGVLATGDGIWPIFNAILDQELYTGTVRSGAFVVKITRAQERRYYYFSLNEALYTLKPWRVGMVYILPRPAFTPVSSSVVRYDEWICPKPVRPIAKIAVTPQDFPFLRQVTVHEEDESVWRTWLKYKSRLQQQSRKTSEESKHEA